MNAVEQRRLWRGEDHPEGPQRGDCLVACAASLFGVPYEEVPDFGGYNDGLQGWLSDVLPGVRARYRDFGSLTETLGSWRSWPATHSEPGYWIAAVYSHRIPDVERFGCGCEGDPSCEWCGGKPETRFMGIAWGLHAVVMLNDRCVWDPHPERDKGFGPFRGATTFHVEDPGALMAAVQRTPLREYPVVEQHPLNNAIEREQAA